MVGDGEVDGVGEVDVFGWDAAVLKESGEEAGT